MFMFGGVKSTCWSDRGIYLEKEHSCKSCKTDYRGMTGGNEMAGASWAAYDQLKCLSSGKNIFVSIYSLLT